MSSFVVEEAFVSREVREAFFAPEFLVTIVSCFVVSKMILPAEGAAAFFAGKRSFLPVNLLVIPAAGTENISVYQDKLRAWR